MRGEGRREPRKAAALQDWDEDAVVSKECSRLATRIVPPKAKAKREQRHPGQLRILILMAKHRAAVSEPRGSAVAARRPASGSNVGPLRAWRV